MRIAMVSRHSPDPEGSPIQKRLYQRLVEFSTLNVELLLLTCYKVEATDREPVVLPKNIDIRRPFTRGTGDEWLRALPLIIGFRPDSIHVIDDRLSQDAESWLSWVRMERLVPALKPMTRLRRVVVSSAAGREALWPGCVFETKWLSEDIDDIQRVRHPSETHHLLLAGTPKSRPSWLSDLERLLSLANEQAQPLALHFECDRTALSQTTRERLAAIERRVGANGQALGAKLFVDLHEMLTRRFDAVLLAGLPRAAWSAAAARWRWYPKVATNLEWPDHSSDPTFIIVPDAAWHAFAVHRLRQEDLLQATWDRIGLEQNARGTDAVNNELSRLHFSTP